MLVMIVYVHVEWECDFVLVECMFLCRSLGVVCACEVGVRGVGLWCKGLRVIDDVPIGKRVPRLCPGCRGGGEAMCKV
jgi:hypothetical protein